MWSPARVNTGNKAQMHYQLISWLCDASVTMCFVLKGGGWKTTGQERETRAFMGAQAHVVARALLVATGKGLLFVFGLLLLPGRIHGVRPARPAIYVTASATLAFSGHDRNKMLMEKNDIQ